jgi:hypothetical protein
MANNSNLPFFFLMLYKKTTILSLSEVKPNIQILFLTFDNNTSRNRNDMPKKQIHTTEPLIVLSLKIHQPRSRILIKGIIKFKQIVPRYEPFDLLRF